MKTSFSWKNYTRPTPRNLEYIATSLRRIIAVIAGTTLVVDSNHWITFSIILGGAILDELKNFFAHAAEGDQETVSVTFPASMSDNVEVKQETKTETTEE